VQGGPEAEGFLAPQRVGLVYVGLYRQHRPRVCSSRSLDDSKRGRGDPDAWLDRGGKGFYLGYRTVFIADIKGFQLGNVDAPANVSKRLLAEHLIDRVLGDDIEIELLTNDSDFESRQVFEVIKTRKVLSLIAWRRVKGRKNLTDILTIKDRIDVEGPEWMRAIYKLLRAMVKGFIGREKSRLAYRRLTWQELKNMDVH
jgi:hypothetical protein